MVRFLSVCSGIEAASVAWNPLGWHAVAFSEIEPFPCAVLAHRYPDVPNWGDMTKFKEWPDADVDLLCGGTPCQSFSVAGLRKGLDDPRGNLMLTFGAIAGRYRPRWLVWENVPGVLSSNGGRDFGTFLGMLEELNYIVDVDILDAQYFGLAQRRRRVFVCAQHLDNLLKQNTNSSALTITQCLMEILQGILVEAFPAFARLPESSEFARVSRDGVLRRIKLFKLLGEEGHWQMLLSNLAGALARCQAEAKNLVERDGEKGKELTAEDLLMGLKMDLPSLPTEESLSKSLGDVYAAMKLFTTSTSTSITTTLQISLFRAVLNIGSLTLHLSGLSPSSSDSELSSLIAIQEYMNYARQASSDLFSEPEWIHTGGDLVREAEQYEKSFGYLGDWRRAAAVLFERHSLSGHPAPSREARKVAPTIPSRSSAGGGLGTDFDCDGGLIPEIAGTMKSCASSGGWSNSADHAAAGYMIPEIAMCHTRGGQQRMDAESETLIPTIAASSPQAQAVAVSLRGRDGGATAELGDEVGNCLRASSGGGDKPYVLTSGVTIHGTDKTASVMSFTDVCGSLRTKPPGSIENSSTTAVYQNMAVRRLTPRECERLQGFPDDYTLTPYRGKPAADGPRYKALGNSWAVPVARWIGERIEQVESLEVA